MQRSGVRSPFAPLLLLNLLIVGALSASSATLAASLSGCNGKVDAAATASIDAAPDASIDATIDPRAAGCPAACDTACLGGTCPPFAIAAGFPVFSPYQDAYAFGLTVDDTGIFVGTGDDVDHGGGVWKCGNSVPAAGETCTVKRLFTKPFTRHIAISPKSIFWTGDLAVPGLLGAVDRNGRDRASVPVADFVDLAVGEPFVFGREASGQVWRCATDSLACTKVSAAARASSIAAGSGFYCGTWEATGKWFVGCSSSADDASRPALSTYSAGRSLRGLALAPHFAYWVVESRELMSMELDASGGPAAGATPAILATGLDPGNDAWPTTADDDAVYFAIPATPAVTNLFVVRRVGGQPPRKVAELTGPVAGIAQHGAYVYALTADAGLVMRVPK